MADELVHHSNNGGGTYEHKDANVRLIVGSTLGLIVGMVILCLIVVGIFNVLQTVTTTHVSGIRNPNVAQVPPEPRLQPHPAIELQALRQHEDDILNHYGWVDQKAGIVRIPIDRAMDIMARRGFPTKSEEAAGNATTNSK